MTSTGDTPRSPTPTARSAVSTMPAAMPPRRDRTSTARAGEPSADPPSRQEHRRRLDQFGGPRPDPRDEQQDAPPSTSPVPNTRAKSIAAGLNMAPCSHRAAPEPPDARAWRTRPPRTTWILSESTRGGARSGGAASTLGHDDMAEKLVITRPDHFARPETSVESRTNAVSQADSASGRSTRSTPNQSHPRSGTENAPNFSVQAASIGVAHAVEA